MEPEVEHAAQEMLSAYDRAIAHLSDSPTTEEVCVIVEKWDTFGEFHSCKLCVATGTNDVDSHCDLCPLGPQTRGCIKGTMRDSFRDLRDAVSRIRDTGCPQPRQSEALAELLRALKERRAILGKVIATARADMADPERWLASGT